jgi:hypothetical protein
MGALRPKKPEPQAREAALAARQERALDDEIEETEGRLRAQRRGQLGTRSLLAGAPASRKAAASGMGRGKASKASMPSAAQRASILSGINVRGIA